MSIYLLNCLRYAMHNASAADLPDSELAVRTLLEIVAFLVK
jgi:hypothetical protein